jgi:YkoY family integral membrane protein
LSLGDLPTIALTIATLVLLEGLLSADNALVLAVMVQHLPAHQQKRALRYGIWGAFVFRAIAVVFAYQLTKYWQLKLLGGLYLVGLALKHFLTHGGGGHDGSERKKKGGGFWWTVLNVELADIAFSVDSILAAVALVEALPPKLQANNTLALCIIYAGGVLGIIMMRLVAGMFLLLLNRYQGLASGAYVLVGWIGLKLLGSGIHSGIHNPRHGAWADQLPTWVRHFPWEMHDGLFWVGMALIAFASLAYRSDRGARRSEAAAHAGVPESEPLHDA